MSLVSDNEVDSSASLDLSVDADSVLEAADVAVLGVESDETSRGSVVGNEWWDQNVDSLLKEDA